MGRAAQGSVDYYVVLGIPATATAFAVLVCQVGDEVVDALAHTHTPAHTHTLTRVNPRTR